MNAQVVIQDNKTRCYAGMGGWVPARLQALEFNSGADAVHFCLNRHYVNVSLVYPFDLRVHIFSSLNPEGLAPVPALAPALP